MWLATISHRDPILRRLVPAHAMRPALVDRAVSILSRTLEGAGDPSIERAYIDAISVGLQRVLTASEIEASPGLASACPVAMAGSPLRVLYHRGGEPAESTKPCERACVGIGAFGPEVVECGACSPCRARNAFASIRG